MLDPEDLVGDVTDSLRFSSCPVIRAISRIDESVDGIPLPKDVLRISPGSALKTGLTDTSAETTTEQVSRIIPIVIFNITGRFLRLIYKPLYNVTAE